MFALFRFLLPPPHTHTFPLITLLCSCLLARLSFLPRFRILMRYYSKCVFLVVVWHVEFSWSSRGVLASAFKHRAKGIQDLVEFNPGIGI